MSCIPRQCLSTNRLDLPKFSSQRNQVKKFCMSGSAIQDSRQLAIQKTLPTHIKVISTRNQPKYSETYFISHLQEPMLRHRMIAVSQRQGTRCMPKQLAKQNIRNVSRTNAIFIDKKHFIQSSSKTCKTLLVNEPFLKLAAWETCDIDGRVLGAFGFKYSHTLEVGQYRHEIVIFKI